MQQVLVRVHVIGLACFAVWGIVAEKAVGECPCACFVRAREARLDAGDDGLYVFEGRWKLCALVRDVVYTGIVNGRFASDKVCMEIITGVLNVRRAANVGVTPERGTQMLKCTRSAPRVSVCCLQQGERTRGISSRCYRVQARHTVWFDL